MRNAAVPGGVHIFFSIVIAVYNGASVLERALQSISSQSFKDFQLIIMDGGSIDGTVGILEKNSALINHWESAPDYGIADAWNKALSKAKGEWIYFLGADDFFCDENSLKRAHDFLISVPTSIKVAYGKVHLVNPQGQVLEASGSPWKSIEKKYRQVSAINHQGVFHRNSLFSTHGGFDLNFRIACDYELLLRELKNNPAEFIDSFVACMQIGGVSSEFKTSKNSLLEFKKAQKKNNVESTSFLWWWTFQKVQTKIMLEKLLGNTLTRTATDVFRVLSGRKRMWLRSGSSKKTSVF